MTVEQARGKPSFDDHGTPRKRIAVDFDGTITKGHAEFWNGEEPEPREEVIEWVNEHYYQGHTIIIWTGRGNGRRAATRRWLHEWEVRYHALRMDKLTADVYVDDRAMNSGSITDGSSGITDIEELHWID